MTYRKSTFYVTQQRAGLSLIEVLIGLTVTLIVLGAMASAFRFASQEMAKGRASLEMTNRLRTIQDLFRDDLRRLTVELKPYHRLPTTPQGYAEIIDGPAVDARNIADDLGTTQRNESVANLLVGDIDDIFAGTIRSDGKPFRGRSGVGMEESHLAEVVWFTTYSDIDGDGDIEPDEGDRIRLFRRQLIVKPSLGILASGLAFPWQVNQFIQNNDISAYVEADPDNSGRFRIVANSLQSLTLRGNRFAHVLETGYPQNSPMFLPWLLNDDQYEDDGVTPVADSDGNGVLNALDFFPHRRASDQSDLLISDVAAFDIRVFAPDAVSLVRWDTALPEVTRPIVDLALPSDLAWQIAAQTVPSASLGFGGKYYDDTGNSFVNENLGSVVVERVNRIGAYVDLGKGVLTSSQITGVPKPIGDNYFAGSLQLNPTGTPALGARNALTFGTAQAVFDTGTSEYDTLALPGVLPLGTNGIDDDNDGIVDEDEKLIPPYDVRIRGLQMTIRTYEPISGQATQMTLKQSMIPQ